MADDPHHLAFQALVFGAAYFWSLLNAPGLAVGLSCVLAAAASFR